MHISSKLLRDVQISKFYFSFETMWVLCPIVNNAYSIFLKLFDFFITRLYTSNMLPCKNLDYPQKNHITVFFMY
jgi:hypothetical protein